MNTARKLCSFLLLATAVYFAQPLYELTRAAQELGAGNLKARVTAAGFGFDETAVLSSAFNEMASRLDLSRAIVQIAGVRAGSDRVAQKRIA